MSTVGLSSSLIGPLPALLRVFRMECSRDGVRFGVRRGVDGSFVSSWLRKTWLRQKAASFSLPFNSVRLLCSTLEIPVARSVPALAAPSNASPRTRNSPSLSLIPNTWSSTTFTRILAS